jgi:hypothetical protein
MAYQQPVCLLEILLDAAQKGKAVFPIKFKSLPLKNGFSTAEKKQAREEPLAGIAF